MQEDSTSLKVYVYLNASRVAIKVMHIMRTDCRSAVVPHDVHCFYGSICGQLVSNCTLHEKRTC